MNPEPPLLAAFAKIEWAEAEINDIEARIQAFFKTSPHELASKTDANGVEIRRIRPPSLPHRFNVTAGKILAALREPLDQMLTALAEHTGKSTAGVQFPFGDTVQRFEEEFMRLAKKKSLPPDALDMIRALQPHREQGNELLYALHAINKRDKHHPRLVAINLRTIIDFHSLVVFRGQILTFGPRSGRHFVLDANSNLSQSETEKMPIFEFVGEGSDAKTIVGCGLKEVPSNLTVATWYNQRGPTPTDVSKIVPLQPGDEDDMELFTCLPGTEFQAEYQPAFSVAFKNIKGLEGEPIPAVMKQMRDLVERILLTFERRFFS